MADGSDEKRKPRLGGRAKLTLAFAGAAAAAGAGLYLKGRRRGATGEDSGEDEVEAHPS